MSLVATFCKSLSVKLAPRSLDVSLWRGGTRASGNLLQISTPPQATVLYAKGSSSNPGFWGLTKNQLDRLAESNARWFCVFLRQSPTAGHLLSGGQIMARVQDGDLTLSGDGDYKINQHAEFVQPQRFDSIEALVPRVL